MSRSKGEQKVNQGHRKSYARMKKTNRHRMRRRLHGAGGKREGFDTTNKAAKADYVI